MYELPSRFLPRVTRSQTPDKLHEALNKLRHIPSEDLESLEKSYVCDWLTKLISSCEDEDILDEAAVLLSHFSVAQGSNSGTRSFSFGSVQGDIHIKLKESEMQDVNATGFCTWSSSTILARRILSEASAFFPSSYQPEGQKLRVLELGSGTGLAGIAALVALKQARRAAHVMLTDYDDTTLDALFTNVSNNVEAGKLDGIVSWEIKKLAWEDLSGMEKHSFDVIIGADIVYEREHPALIQNLVTELLVKEGVFHLVVPIRYTHQADIDDLERLFSSSEGCGPGILDKEDIEKDDTGQYPHRYYRIG